MLQTIIRLPDGAFIGTGPGEKATIKSYKHTACVNDSEELSIGSVCANSVEITIFDIGGTVNLTSGDEIEVFRGTKDPEDRVGIFVLENPSRPTANTMKLVGYDRIIRLDKDLTGWLNGLKNWPYKLSDFAEMVCDACNLYFPVVDWSTVPNHDYLVQKFSYTGVTGRQLMKWIGQICARFFYANKNGNIEFGWYKPSGVTLLPSGERFYFEGGLTFEAYQTAPIETVQLQLADSKSGALWPERDASLNSYVITNNAILQAQIADDVLPYLDVIANALKGYTYTPCKVAIPTSQDIPAGSTVDIIDRNGKKITAYVMTKVTEGQKDTIECTGSARRDSTTNLNNKRPASQTDAANAAKNAVQKAQEIFGEKQGLYYQDGKWYINAEVVQVLNLVADMINAGTLYGMLIKAGKIQSEDGNIVIDLTQGNEPVFNGGISTNSLTVRSDMANSDNIFSVFSSKLAENLYSVGMQMRMADGKEIFRVSEYTSGNTTLLNGMKFALFSPAGSGEVIASTDENRSSIDVRGSGPDSPGVEIFSNPYISGSNYSAGLVLMTNRISPAGYFRLMTDGTTALKTDVINERTVSWKANGDGTYTLIGV